MSNVTNDDPLPGLNKTMLQGFEWYSAGNNIGLVKDPRSGVFKDISISHWQYLTQLLPRIRNLGITSIWIPPGCKGTGLKDNGYGIHDLYDLGEFETKGGKSTKWGTKEQLVDLCAQAQSQGIAIIFDAVLNHRAGPDASEESVAVRVNPKNRNQDFDSKPRKIRSWTKFNYAARNGTFSSLKYNQSHFSGVDYDSMSKEHGIFKILGTRPDGSKKGWAKDVAKSENGNYDYLMFADLDYGSSEVREDVKRWGCWLVDQLSGVRGFRLDAMKHYSASFQKQFIDEVGKHANKDGGNFFFVGEYWLQNSNGLSKHIDSTFQGRIHLFDVRLMYNFHEISTGRIRDLRNVFANSLVALQPRRAVTFVTNHDTQETQSLAAPIEPWFIPHAYALILLRKDGHPCVFWGDVYGTQGPKPRLPACGGRLVRIIKARELFAYGTQLDYFSTKDPSLGSHAVSHDSSCVAWSRSWESSSKVMLGLVAVVSISWSWKKRKVSVGKQCSGQIWTDIMGWIWSGVLIDNNGFGDFPVGPRSISIWTWQKAPGREKIDGLVHPDEPPMESDSVEALEDTLNREEDVPLDENDQIQ